MKVGDMVKFKEFQSDETFIIIESIALKTGEVTIDLLTVNGEVMHAHDPDAFEVIKDANQ